MPVSNKFSTLCIIRWFASQRLEKQLNDALRKLAGAQDSLEHETLSKTDLENKLKTAIEDSQFQTSLLQSVGSERLWATLVYSKYTYNERQRIVYRKSSVSPCRWQRSTLPFVCSQDQTYLTVPMNSVRWSRMPKVNLRKIWNVLMARRFVTQFSTPDIAFHCQSNSSCLFLSDLIISLMVTDWFVRATCWVPEESYSGSGKCLRWLPERSKGNSAWQQGFVKAGSCWNHSPG